jgi:FkbM family methyltransferase
MKKFCLENIYSRLGDEESRFLFERRLCYSLTGDLSRMVHTINGRVHTFTNELSRIVHNINKRIYTFPKSKENFFIFGSGDYGHNIISIFPEICWSAFIDNDSTKVGKQDVLPIISFQEFIENSKNAVVFISSPIYGNEMKQQLINNGFSDDFIIPPIIYGTQYFDIEYFKPQKNEFFIDAGSCDGGSTIDFFKWLGDYKRDGKSIAFEPNPIFYNDYCKKNLKNYDNVEIVNKGLWHKNETLKFHKMGGSSHISPDGEEIIEVISLDEYLKDEKKPVTFIKMDIEGTELNALKGAEQTIRKYKPKLAICIYHKPEDVWEIPNLLLEFVPDYKFYIRHYCLTHVETVLYALHNENG